AKQGRQVEKNRLGNEDGANGLIVQRLPKSVIVLMRSFGENRTRMMQIVWEKYFSRLAKPFADDSA
ncbi:hypothetical protein, partial [Pseudomonas amygdali]|uniref:hypothetical protein n=1 Tax=Pseudomonas amygdali TaxID=47877 RepID=UPI001F417AE4